MNLRILLFLLSSSLCFAQADIRGSIIDQQTLEPLAGASIYLNGETQTAVLSDAEGNFILPKVTAGRYFLRITFLGYQPKETETFIHQSTRESSLEIKLKPGSIQADEVVISANKNAFEPLNDLSIVSTRSFTAEETERIPAGVNDPGRVVLSYPGVTIGNDDNENQIIVRGNSPIGILWRLEGIDIPNPNHFAVIGSSGGGITVFSAQLLAKSDFNTGGFAAEYGNALSGAFDVQFRPGNLEKRNHRMRIGVLGLDFATEGPIQKGRSSYLVNYRYSTLGLLSSMGFYLVGERVTNEFQDLSFNLTFRSKDQRGVTTVFGLGGLSEENYQPVEDPELRDLNISNHSEDRVRPANMGAMGLTHTYRINSRSYIKAVAAVVASDIRVRNDTLNLLNERFRYETQQFTDRRFVSSLTYQTKLGENSIFKTGVIGNLIGFDFFKETRQRRSTSDINEQQRNISVQGSDQTYTLQHYSQVAITKGKFRMLGGYHVLGLGLINKYTAEPRFSVQFAPNAAHRLSLSYGRHSQVVPLMNYFYTNETGSPNNLDLMKTRHLVAAWHWYTKNKMRFTVEAYKQWLFDIPASPREGSSWWMLNSQGNFPEFEVVSEGTGENQGLDLAIEKSFTKGWYFLSNASILSGSYSMPDGRTFISRFSIGYSSAITAGKEFYFKKGRILQVGARYMNKGGLRYTPPDEAASTASGFFVADETRVNEGQIPGYKRIDARISYAYNAKKVAGKINLDIQNLLDTRNATGIAYNVSTRDLQVQYRGSGFTPVLSFQWDF